MRHLIIILMTVMLSILSGDLFAQDAENVEQVGRSYYYWSFARNVTVVGNLAYVAMEISGLQIVDISDPEYPEVIGSYEDSPKSVKNVAVSSDYVYIAYNRGGFWILPVADPEHQSTR